MNAELNYIIVRQRDAELQRAGHQARLAHEGRRKPPDPHPSLNVPSTSSMW
jgi:hypothetical protein